MRGTFRPVIWDCSKLFFNANYAVYRTVISIRCKKFSIPLSGDVYAIYLADSNAYTLDLSAVEGTFSLQWFNPLAGGELQSGTVETLKGGGIRALGAPPSGMHPANQDWVVLVRKVEAN